MLRLNEMRVIRLVADNPYGLVLGAAKDVLDRGGLKAADRVEVAASITVTRPFHPGVRRTPLGSSLDNSR